MCYQVGEPTGDRKDSPSFTNTTLTCYRSPMVEKNGGKKFPFQTYLRMPGFALRLLGAKVSVSSL